MELMLGKTIRALRTQKGVTQEALAAHLGVTFQAVSKWEVGATTPDIGLLPDIAVYFGVPIDALFSLPEDARLSRIENFINDARNLTREQFAGAEDYLTEVLAHDPDNARACRLLAMLYLKEANTLRERASGYARHALLLTPGSKYLLSTLKEAMGGLNGDYYANRHYRFIGFLEEFTGAHPEIFHARQYLMDHLLADSRLDEAEDLLKEMQSRFPRHARNLFYEGDIAYLRGRREEAFALWERGISDHDGPANLGHFYYAERMERIGDYDRAIEEYRLDYELSEKPRFVDSLIAMAQIHEMRGDYEQAAAMFEEEICLFKTEWGVVSGERIDRPRREIERLMGR